jgi:hypothetical protein
MDLVFLLPNGKNLPQTKKKKKHQWQTIFFWSNSTLNYTGIL